LAALARLRLVLAGSKRTELVTLNASALNCTPCCSLILNRFPNEASIPKAPSPRTPLRCPTLPGNVQLYDANAGVGVGNRFGPGFPPVAGAGAFLVVDCSTGPPVCVA